MSQIENSLHTPYGAHALKATYQRNLMLGNLTVLLLVAALTSTLVLFSGGDKVVIDVPPPPPPIKIYLDPPPTIVLEEPPVSPGARVAPVGKLGIPVPMPDTAILDPDQVLISKAEKALLVEGIDPSAGGGGTGEGRLEVNTNIPDAFPPIDSFFVVERRPVLINSVKPEYPHFAKLAGLEGTVWIKALVDIEGKVRDAVVYRTSDTPDLDEAALKVAWDYRYKPANQNGQPVPVWVTYRVDFKLDD